MVAGLHQDGQTVPHVEHFHHRGAFTGTRRLPEKHRYQREPSQTAGRQGKRRQRRRRAHCGHRQYPAGRSGQGHRGPRQLRKRTQAIPRPLQQRSRDQDQQFTGAMHRSRRDRGKAQRDQDKAEQGNRQNVHDRRDQRNLVEEEDHHRNQAKGDSPLHLDDGGHGPRQGAPRGRLALAASQLPQQRHGDERQPERSAERRRRVPMPAPAGRPSTGRSTYPPSAC